MRAQDRINLKDGSASATIIAAIIGAATAAATEIANIAASKPGNPVYGVINNQSKHELKIFDFGPYHGESFESPGFLIEGTDFVAAKFLEAVIARFGESYTQEQLGDEKNVWIRKKLFEKYAEESITKFGGTGIGMGFEQVIALYNETIGKLITILVRRIPGGNYGAGVEIQDFDDIDSLKEKKPYGYDFKTSIQNAKSTDTARQYSDGSTQISAMYGNLKVSISAPGAEMKISIEDAS